MRSQRGSITLIAALAALPSCADENSPSREAPVPGSNDPVVEHFPSPLESMRSLPFSEAVRVGDLLFVSGQIGNTPGTLQLVPGGIAAETKQTLENIRDIMERHGSSLDRVVKCTVFLADMGEWQAMNEVYRTFFPTRPPARSALGANGLALGGRLEIEAIAILPDA